MFNGLTRRTTWRKKKMEMEKMKANFRVYTTTLHQAYGKEMDTWIR